MIYPRTWLHAWALGGAIGVLGASSLAAEEPGAFSASVSPPAVWTAHMPAAAQPLAEALQQALKIFGLWQDAQQHLQHLRNEHDLVRTELIAVAGGLQVIERDVTQTQEQVQARGRMRQTRFETLKTQLETELQQQLQQTRLDMSDELQRDCSRQVRAFEARQQELMMQGEGQESQLQEAQVQQLSQEIESQAKELVARLQQFELGSDVAKSVEESTTRLIHQRRQELETRRQQLETERNALLAKRRAEFSENLKAQQERELASRLVAKEAGLRQSMAMLLQQSYEQDAGALQQLESQLQRIQERQAELASRKSVLDARVQTLLRGIAEMNTNIDAIEAKRQATLVSIHQVFQQLNPQPHDETLTWFDIAIQDAPSEMASELGLIRQRVVAQVEQVRQLQEQQRVLRERHVAMEAAQEMERRHLEVQRQRQRELEWKSRKADELIAGAKDAANHEQYARSLELLGQAQALQPPQAGAIVVLEEDYRAKQTQHEQAAQQSQVQDTFLKAMDAFNGGRYQDAIGLFEKVVTQESALGMTAQQPAAATPPAAEEP